MALTKQDIGRITNVNNLSEYTLAKNCVDIEDCESGLFELKQYFDKCDRYGKEIPPRARIRFSRLSDKKEKLQSKLNSPQKTL